MEAQAGKLFRTGKALRILLTVFNVVLVIGCVLTAAELLGYISRPFGEVEFIVEAVEHTVGSRVLLDIGSIAYSIAYVVCIIIVFTCCIRMTRKMSQDKYPFNSENVHLLRRMALVYIVAAAAALLFSTMNAVASGMGIGNVVLSAVMSAAQQIVIALLLRFLADVFEYGVELQQLSDETL